MDGDLPKECLVTDLGTATLVPLDFSGPRDRLFQPLPADWVEIPITRHFSEIAARQPHKVAVRDRHVSLSYREFEDAVDRLSDAIAAIPVRYGTVAILLPNSAFSPIAAMACLAAGRVFVPFNANYPAAHVASLISDCALDAVVIAGSDTASWDLRPDLPHIDVAACLEGPVPGRREGLVGGDRPAVILHTSGSSGRPRAIVISQAGLLQRVLQHVNACHISCVDHVCPLSSPCTISGAREQFAALLAGATLHVVDPQADGLADLRRTIARRKVTILYSVPALARALLQTTGPTDDFASLRVLRIGGDRVLWRDIASLHNALPATCLVQISFSSTEAPGMQWFVRPAVADEGAAAPIGYPVPGLEVEIVDEHHRPVTPGEFGELVLRSRFVALGLWQGGICVPGPFRPDPVIAGCRSYATGDFAALRPDGLYLFGGRRDRQIKIRGQRVDTSEVEAVLGAVEDVLDVVALDAGDGHEPALVAFIEARQSLDPDLLLRRADLALRTLPDMMRPSRRHIVPRIARLPSAKPDMAALRELDRERRQQHALACDPEASNGSTIEQLVAQCWRDALGGGGGLTWAEAGGDSLRLLEFVLALERHVGCRLRLELFNGDMRKADVAAAIGQSLQPAPADASDKRPLVLFFSGIEDDNPALARFRDALRDRVRFETIAYPDWQTMVRIGGGLDRFVDLACEGILETVGDTPLHLAGYSFGGVVALVAAARLIEQRRHVKGLAVFDTNLENFDDAPARATAPWRGNLIERLSRARVRWKTGAVTALSDRLAGLAFSRLTVRAGRRLLPLPLPRVLPRSIDLVFRWKLRRNMAMTWLAHHADVRVDIPVTVFRTDDHVDGTPLDLGWSRRAVPVSVHGVSGGHLTMFWGLRAAALADQFENLCLRSDEA